MLSIRTANNPDEFARLEPLWDRLLSGSDLDNPFMTFDWLRLYWRMFEKNSAMTVIVLYRDGEPVAAAPLMRVKMFWRGVRHTALTFIANYFSNVTGIIDISGENVLPLVLEHLRRSRVGFDTFYVNFVPDGTATDRMLRRTVAELGLRSRVMAGDNSPYIKLPSSWEEYIRTKNKHFRHNHNRMVRTFEESGEYTVRSYSRPEDIPGAWEKVLAVSRRTWKYRHGTAIASAPSYNNFYRSCAEWAAGKGWFKLLILEHKERPVAFCYDLPYKHTVWSNKSGFDEEYSRYSPGMYILSRSIREAIDAGFSEFNLMGKNEEYKKKFTPLLRPQNKYIIFNRTGLGKLLACYELKMIPAGRKTLSRIRRRETGEPEAKGPAETVLSYVKTPRENVMGSLFRRGRLGPIRNLLKTLSGPEMR